MAASTSHPDAVALISRDAAAAAAAWASADDAVLDAEVDAYRALLARLRADLAVVGVPASLEDGGAGEAEAIEGVEVSVLETGAGPDARALGRAQTPVAASARAPRPPLSRLMRGLRS
jgi:hypothetical protein